MAQEKENTGVEFAGAVDWQGEEVEKLRAEESKKKTLRGRGTESAEKRKRTGLKTGHYKNAGETKAEKEKSPPSKTEGGAPASDEWASEQSLRTLIQSFWLYF